MELAVDKIRTLVLEARRIDVKEADSDPDSGSNPIDDNDADMLTSSDRDDASEGEFRGLVAGLNVDERAELLGLIYVGRGDFTESEWDEAVSLGRERDRVSGHFIDYLLGTPNLPDLIEEGLAARGIGMADDSIEDLDDASGDDTVEIHHLRRPLPTD